MPAATQDNVDDANDGYESDLKSVEEEELTEYQMEKIDADGNITVRTRTDIDVNDTKSEEERGNAVQADNQRRATAVMVATVWEM